MDSITYYELVLHDLENLNSQVLYCFGAEDKKIADEIADKLTWILGHNGRGNQIEIEVYEREEVLEDWQINGDG